MALQITTFQSNLFLWRKNMLNNQINFVEFEFTVHCTAMGDDTMHSIYRCVCWVLRKGKETREKENNIKQNVWFINSSIECRWKNNFNTSCISISQNHLQLIESRTIHAAFVNDIEWVQCIRTAHPTQSREIDINKTWTVQSWKHDRLSSIVSERARASNNNDGA